MKKTLCIVAIFPVSLFYAGMLVLFQADGKSVGAMMVMGSFIFAAWATTLALLYLLSEEK